MNPPDPAARSEWIAAALRLAADRGVGAVTPEAIAPADAAGFAAAFPDREAYLNALMTHGLDEVRAAVVQITLQRKPGVERLTAALTTWLDANLARPWLRDLILQQSLSPLAADTLRKRVNGFILMLQLEFETMGWPRAGLSARLAVAAMIEVALAEFEAHQIQPAMRESLLAYLRKSG